MKQQESNVNPWSPQEATNMRMLQSMEKRLAQSEKKERRRGFFKKIKIALVLLLLLAIVIAVLAIINAFSKPVTFNSSVTGGGGLTLANIHSDICNIILGEAREKKNLIVLEQDVEVTSSLESTPFIQWDVFKKAKTIFSFGTGVYTVDMGAITQANISINDNTRVISITIPKTVLDHVYVDKEKMKMSDTEHGLLAFGDIQLTVEQQKELDESIVEAMQNKLGEADIVARADETALAKVSEIFQPLINLKYSEYRVKVTF